MPSALRRSRRAVLTQASTYNVGDIVEIIRGNAVLKGQLAFKLTEIPSALNPRWLVNVDGKEEKLYEHLFGKVLKKASDINNDDDIKTMPPPSNRRSTRQSSSSSEGEQPPVTKRVTFSESSPTASDDSSADGVSAREQRSRRRQAKVDTEVTLHNTRKRSHLSTQDDSGTNKKMRDENDLVVVKLLTGTLYLYKGPHRRAEFVRSV